MQLWTTAHNSEDRLVGTAEVSVRDVQAAKTPKLANDQDATQGPNRGRASSFAGRVSRSSDSEHCEIRLDVNDEHGEPATCDSIVSIDGQKPSENTTLAMWQSAMKLTLTLKVMYHSNKGNRKDKHNKDNHGPEEPSSQASEKSGLLGADDVIRRAPQEGQRLSCCSAPGDRARSRRNLAESSADLNSSDQLTLRYMVRHYESHGVNDELDFVTRYLGNLYEEGAHKTCDYNIQNCNIKSPVNQVVRDIWNAHVQHDERLRAQVSRLPSRSAHTPATCIARVPFWKEAPPPPLFLFSWSSQQT